MSVLIKILLVLGAVTIGGVVVVAGVVVRNGLRAFPPSPIRFPPTPR